MHSLYPPEDCIGRERRSLKHLKGTYLYSHLWTWLKYGMSHHCLTNQFILDYQIGMPIEHIIFTHLSFLGINDLHQTIHQALFILGRMEMG